MIRKNIGFEVDDAVTENLHSDGSALHDVHYKLKDAVMRNVSGGYWSDLESTIEARVRRNVADGVHSAMNPMSDIILTALRGTWTRF